jgi:hypothetical protein
MLQPVRDSGRAVVGNGSPQIVLPALPLLTQPTLQAAIVRR